MEEIKDHSSSDYENGARDRSRTCDLPIRNRLLYPTELPERRVDPYQKVH